MSNIDTTNPMNEGVSYEAFLKNVGKKNSVDDLLNKHKLSQEAKNWIKKELQTIQLKNK